MDLPEKIGKYKILDKIGEGGFGVVYKGKDPFIKRLVAIKTCTSGDERVKSRFFREAEIAGNLHHVNVVTIHDFGLEGSIPYLVQEFLTGDDLDELIREGRELLPLHLKVRFLRGIAEGLQYAHAHDVIHRDVKPSNIRVMEGGRVKVMDFGIARLKDEENRLTKTGMTVGTVAYLSPEQLRGDAVDHRTDLFSFGVLAYELLTGARPFRGDTISMLFYRLLNEPPPPIVDEEIPETLRVVVNRCLAKDPSERYAGFSDVLLALEDVEAEVPGDPETDPFWSQRSPITDKLSRLAVRTAQALEARDLTAAEMTLSIARREVDSQVFERDFAPLSSALERLKQEISVDLPASAQVQVAPTPAVESASAELAAIERTLDENRFDEAAIALTGLEIRHPDLPGIQRLHERMTRAHLRREVGASVQLSAPPPRDLATSRRRALIVAAALGVLVVALIVAVAVTGSRAARPFPAALAGPVGVEPSPPLGTLAEPAPDVDAIPPAVLARVQVAEADEEAPRVEVKTAVEERPPVVRPASAATEPERPALPSPEGAAQESSPSGSADAAAEPTPVGLQATTVSETAMRDLAAVEQTLKVYQEAWRDLDWRAIRRVHPGAVIRPPRLRGVQSAEVVLQGCVYEVRPGDAIAHCQGERRLVLNNRQVMVESFNQIDFRPRRGGGWVIEAVR